MSEQMTFSSFEGSRSLQLIRDSMLQSDELPLTEALDDHQWQEVFTKHGIDFGNTEDAVYTPAMTLWALISQAFFKGEMRSCKAAVARVATLWATLGRTVCSSNTGAYCRARAKLTWEAVRDISMQIAESAGLSASLLICSSRAVIHSTVSSRKSWKRHPVVASCWSMASRSRQPTRLRTRKRSRKILRKRKGLDFPLSEALV